MFFRSPFYAFAAMGTGALALLDWASWEIGAGIFWAICSIFAAFIARSLSKGSANV
jgi:hypothetical protein